MKYISKTKRGGEPTGHPDFCRLLLTTHNYNIMPNYTTNGMFIRQDNVKKILEVTKKYCGGVAVSCHSHLKDYWVPVIELFYEMDIELNLHIIISDRKSVDEFFKIYKQFEGVVKYFVLLPYEAVGRATPVNIEFDYLFQRLRDTNSTKDIELMNSDGIIFSGAPKNIAFGANFYTYLRNNDVHWLGLSLYEPESMSKYIDFKDMKIYPSSFLTDKPLDWNWIC